MSRGFLCKRFTGRKKTNGKDPIKKDNGSEKKMETNQHAQKIKDYDRLSMVAYFLKGSKRFFALGVICSLIVAFLDMLGPKVVQYTIDEIIGDDKAAPVFVQSLIEAFGGRAYLRSHLFGIALLIVGIALAAGVCRYLYRLLNAMGAEKLIRRMRDQLFVHIEHLPYAWHGKNHTGDIIQRCTSDVETIKNFLSEQMT
ncbi:MAG: hypothetical protein K6E18_03695, partial [Lachnospiraceae bacterium]|nr:hypothetical protein [Lachnospiraceae bacterium]